MIYENYQQIQALSKRGSEISGRTLSVFLAWSPGSSVRFIIWDQMGSRQTSSIHQLGSRDRIASAFYLPKAKSIFILDGWEVGSSWEPLQTLFCWPNSHHEWENLHKRLLPLMHTVHLAGELTPCVPLLWGWFWSTRHLSHPRLLPSAVHWCSTPQLVQGL